MRIVDLVAADERWMAQVGALLRSVKPERNPMPVVWQSLAEGQYCRVTVDGADRVSGWLWGRPLFEGESWELKWLIVDPALQRSGIGSALVRDFEAWCAARGVLTIWLMTGEELGRTNLFGTDLFDRPLEKLQSLELLADHPIRFYQSLGYQIIGVIPDANGMGCPEYLMGKSLFRERKQGNSPG
ncbi:MAG TPA: GNAT family N-acetyltransferase [bacterium]|nr:GNAT family N-acetyltransferase [bacterium]